MRRRCGGTTTPARGVGEHAPVDHDPAASGRIRPAMTLSSVVLPAPDGPEQGDDPRRRVAKRDVEREVALAVADGDLDHVSRPGPRRPAGSGARTRPRRASAIAIATRLRRERAGLAARHLGVGVDRGRHVWVSPGIAETKVMVAPNSPSALAKARIMPARTPGSASGSVIVANTARAVGAERAGGLLEPAVDRLEREPDRAHHQRKRHDRRGERGAGPAEGEHDAAAGLERRRRPARGGRRRGAGGSPSPPAAARAAGARGRRAAPGRGSARAPAHRRRRSPSGRLASVAPTATLRLRRTAIHSSGRERHGSVEGREALAGEDARRRRGARRASRKRARASGPARRR